MSKSDTPTSDGDGTGENGKRYDPEKYEANSEQRAEWEAFAFEVQDDGIIEVTNESHENPEDHQYLVSLDDRIENGCTCKAAKYFEEDCKHRRACRNHPAVRMAAQTATERFNSTAVRADGGSVAVAPQATETCPNGQEGCGGPEENEIEEGLSCFECYLEYSG